MQLLFRSTLLFLFVILLGLTASAELGQPGTPEIEFDDVEEWTVVEDVTGDVTENPSADVIDLRLFALDAADFQLAQTAPVVVPVPGPEPDPPMAPWLALALALFIPLCNVIAATFPSTNGLMKIIDVFAANWGKARSDPAAQKWGK